MINYYPLLCCCHATSHWCITVPNAFLQNIPWFKRLERTVGMTYFWSDPLHPKLGLEMNVSVYFEVLRSPKKGISP